MHVQVRYFAQLRERRGTDFERVEVPDGATARDVYAQVFPTESMRLPVAFAVAHTAVPGDRVLHDGDELALLPPLGGG